MSTTGLFAGTPVNNDDLGPEIIIASWALTTVSGIFLFMRIFAKIWTRRGLWLDDYILIVAWVRTTYPPPVWPLSRLGLLNILISLLYLRLP